MSEDMIDADMTATLAEMRHVGPFLSPGWREHLSTGGGLAGIGYSLPGIPYRPLAPPSDDGAPPLERARRRLAEHGASLAVLNPGTAPGLSGVANIVMAAEIARATNDWLADTILVEDERLYGSILVTARDGELAAAEVRRCGVHPGMAQIVLAYPPGLLGDRALLPLFEAAEELGLPISLQSGGALAGVNRGPAAAGHPSTLFEYQIDSAYGAIPHLTSMLCEGVFERFPGLRLVLSGFGIGWLPSLLWRLDAAFADGVGLPKTLTRLPSELVAEHVRCTTLGLERPGDPATLGELPAIDAGGLLLYASGPSAESPGRCVAPFGEHARSAVLCGNARGVLRLRR
jgi:predicted TIM-barrel fold metal-dependent hydrolase